MICDFMFVFLCRPTRLRQGGVNRQINCKCYDVLYENTSNIHSAHFQAAFMAVGVAEKEAPSTHADVPSSNRSILTLRSEALRARPCRRSRDAHRPRPRTRVAWCGPARCSRAGPNAGPPAARWSRLGRRPPGGDGRPFEPMALASALMARCRKELRSLRHITERPSSASQTFNQPSMLPDA